MADLALPRERLPRMIEIQPLDPDSADKGEQHKQRRQGVALRRRYYEGTQYVDENAARAEKLKKEDPSFADKWQRLPEHHRIHTYSTHANTGVNFLADQITGQMSIRSVPVEVEEEEAEDSDEPTPVEDWIERSFKRSGLKYRKQELARETMIAGDLFCHCVMAPHPDEDEPQQVWHLWEAETVEPDYDDDDWQKLVEIRTEEKVFRPDPDDEEKMVEVRQVKRWTMMPVSIIDPDGDAPITVSDPESFGDEFLDMEIREAKECILITEEDGVEVDRQPLGIPFIPWVHIHGENQSLRTMHGRPLISYQLMETIDRYNTTMQLEFLAVRYNSFGNLAVVGDEAYLREQQGDDAGAYTIHKDIADAIVFPGGTDVKSIHLEINVEAFNAHLEQLDKAIFDLMGLEKLDTETIPNVGGISGYALEILNRKTDGTFRRITENQRDGIQNMIEMGLRVDAIARMPVNDAGVREWWNLDIDDVWPDRDVDIDFGTAYIVDEVAVRDDFTANLISRREALKKRGYNDDQIEEIEAAIAEQSEQAEQRIGSAIAQGSRFDSERS